MQCRKQLLSKNKVKKIDIYDEFCIFTCNTHITTSGTNKNMKIREVQSKPAFTCSKLTIETLEQGVKYVQS